jgi:hypothetical protein
MSLPDSLMPKEEIGRRPWSRFRTTDYLNLEHRTTSPSEDVIFGAEPDVRHRCSIAKFIYTCMWLSPENAVLDFKLFSEIKHSPR